MQKVKIVAEIGCNHNGNVTLAKRLMELAKVSGADAVKFQSFIPENLVSRYAPKANYQKAEEPGDSQLDMLRGLALNEQEYLELVDYAKNIDIEIFSTAFDDISLVFLQEIGQSMWKIPSGEINNLPFLEKISNIECAEKEIILSTGMSTIEEIEFAVKILSQSKDTQFSILHCNTQYPTKPEDMNLRVLSSLQSLAPGWQIGLSDHSEGITAALVAVGLGAKFIEKHFTLDRSLPGPDHKASITPKELKVLCDNIRIAEIMLGTSDKHVTASEKENILAARKSIVAKKRIRKGEIFSEENIVCKRPGNGISPMFWYKLIGLKAEKDFYEDELISYHGINWNN